METGMLHDRVHAVQDGRPIADDVQTLPVQQQSLADLIHLATGIVRRQWLVILFGALLGLGVGVIYLSIATPIYMAQTSLYVDLHRNPVDLQPGIFSNDPIEIESQIQLIKSKTVASTVIKKLQLNAAGSDSSSELDGENDSSV